MCLNNLKPLSNNSKEHLERCRNCRIAPVPVRPVSCQTLITKRVGLEGCDGYSSTQMEPKVQLGESFVFPQPYLQGD